MNFFIVDDEIVLLEFLRIDCQRLGLEVAGTASSGGAAIDEIKKIKPAMVILDLILPGLSGIEVVEAISAVSPKPRVLIFSTLCNEFVTYRLDRAIHGYILKTDTTTAELEQAIRTVADGQRYFCERYVQSRRQLLQSPVGFTKLLTRSELAVLTRVARCEEDSTIARELRVSVRTVEKHRSNMMRKLRLTSRLSLERYGREHGFGTV